MADTKPQKPTKTHGELEPKYQTAIYWRVLGLPFPVIASKLGAILQKNVRPDLVREWFAKGGICHDAYKAELEERKKEGSEILNQIDEKISEMVPAALGVISQSVEAGNLGAALRVLELKGYTPVKKIEDVTPNSEELELLKKIISENDKPTRKHLPNKRKPNKS